MYCECKSLILIKASAKSINGKSFLSKYLFLESTKSVVIFLSKTSLISVLRACLKGKSYAPSFIGGVIWSVCGELLNSTCTLGISTTFPRIPWIYAPRFAGKGVSRVQPSCQCLRCAFEQLVWNWTKGKMLARAFAKVRCNRLSRETTRTVGLGATGRQDRQASTEVCTELGSLKTS